MLKNCGYFCMHNLFKKLSSVFLVNIRNHDAANYSKKARNHKIVPALTYPCAITPCIYTLTMMFPCLRLTNLINARIYLSNANFPSTKSYICRNPQKVDIKHSDDCIPKLNIFRSEVLLETIEYKIYVFLNFNRSS